MSCFLGLMDFLTHNTSILHIHMFFYVGLDALGHYENKSVPPPPPRSFMEKSKFNTVRRSEEKKKPPSTFFKFIL